jgi:hypothetical protein
MALLRGANTTSGRRATVHPTAAAATTPTPRMIQDQGEPAVPAFTRMNSNPKIDPISRAVVPLVTGRVNSHSGRSAWPGPVGQRTRARR